jgi:preprotein translocase subunit SecB
MKLAPLALNGCYLTKIDITAQSNVKKDNSDFDVLVDPSVFPAGGENNHQWFAFVDVTLVQKGENTPPYLGQVKMMAGFTVDESWPASDAERLVFINGCGTVYGAIREMICNVTARGFFTAITLPAWSFSEMYKDYLEQRQKAQAQPEPNTDQAETPKSDASSPNAP